MANISWDSVSINNYFSNSLGKLKNTSCSAIYSSISDYKLIKNGNYKKLMSAYYDKLEKEEKENEETQTDKTTGKKDSKSAVKNSDTSGFNFDALI